MVRYWLFIGSCLLLWIGAGQAQSSLIQEAAKAYENANYADAISLYEKSLAEQTSTAELYYNLGSAYYAADESATAMLYFRRAERLAPRNPTIQNALKQARSELGTTSVTHHWLDSIATFSAAILTSFELALIVFALWSLVWSLITWRRLRRSNARPYLLLIMSLLLLAGTVMLGSRLYVEQQRPSAVMMQAATPIYSGAGDDYLQLFTVDAATEMRVIARQDDWRRVQLRDGRQGWLRAEAIEEV